VWRACLVPSDKTRTFGPDDAAESARGLALDFCLVATQHRHIDDTRLEAPSGAGEWLFLARTFVWAPTDSPASGTRP